MLKAATWSFLMALVAGAAAGGAQEHFVFSGLSLSTTVAEASDQYPHSVILDHHVYVSEIDVRNHVYAIEIPTATSPVLRVFFERAVNGGPEYPPCDALIDTLRQVYGEPTGVVDFDEERVRNRRYSWKGANATLAVACFRVAGLTFRASELSISTARQ